MKLALTQRIHVSWLIAQLAAAVFCGIWLAQYSSLFNAISWPVMGCFLCGVCLLTRYRAVVPLLLVGGCMIGLWRGGVDQITLHRARQVIGGAHIISGTVADDSDSDKQGNVALRLKNITIDNKVRVSSAWVVLTGEVALGRSDQVVISGKATEGFGSFAFSMYRATLISSKRPQPGDVALRVRDWFADLVRKAVPEPEASLGIGFLVGQRRSLPNDLDVALKVAGLTHIVVASGYNLTILVRLARRLFAKLSRYLATLVSGSLIVGFILVTGLSPSMSRAGLVAGLSLLTWYYGRKIHPVVLLLFAIGVTVFINPSYAWGDIGWQLSFAAFAGVMLLAPLLQAYYFGNEKPGIIRQILGETIAATLMTAPILILNFGYISNIAIVANLLVLPFVPLAMLLTFVAGIGSLVVPSLATAIGLLATTILTYIVQIVIWCSSLPWAVSITAMMNWQAVFLYGMLTLFMIYMWCKTKLSLRDTNLVE